MKIVYKLLVHITMILAALFLTLAIIDRFNPSMEFLNSDVTDYFLLAFCASALASSIATAVHIFKHGHKKK